MAKQKTKTQHIGRLGIYLSSDHATVVFLDCGLNKRELKGAFSIALPKQSEEKDQNIPELIAKQITERKWSYSEVSIALDCKQFMQHEIKSEFTDHKQISATIQFDAEEQLATDASDIAVAYKLKSTLQTGSKIDVYTASQKTLEKIITDAQTAGLDPVAIEPDAYCLRRFVEKTEYFAQDPQNPALLVMLSKNNGYILADSQFDDTTEKAERTFLIGNQNRTALISRQIPVTLPMLGEGLSDNILYLDAEKTLDQKTAAENTCLNFKKVDIPEFENYDQTDPVELAIAYGAAIHYLDKTPSINFRSRFMPYMGKKIRIQRAAKMLSISAAVLLIAIGALGQFSMFKKSAPLKQLRKGFEQDYKIVMQGKKLDRRLDPVRKLRSELFRIENIKKGRLSASGEASISAKLTTILDAFNTVADQTNLSIDKITIHKNGIKVIGKTSSRANTLKLFESIKKDMDIQSDRVETKSGEDVFSLSLQMKR